MILRSKKQELTKYALLLIEKVKTQIDSFHVDLQHINIDV